ncbi:MAG: hypothetical protein HC765_08730 [Brachymonas sp.]|nr:hypothetical protein [Brachymonas sp.]
MHITCNHELLALIDADERTATLKINVHAVPLESLSWQEKHSAARYHSGLKGEGFVTIPIYHLLWFYGQRVADAVSDLPSNFGSSVLQLRRLPLIDPALLHMRHLALMHRFSGGAAYFSALYHSMHGDEQLCLCADLASMYFTGALKQME